MSKIIWKPGNMLYPLPTVMVSVGGKDFKPNIITIAWAGTVCSNPPMVSISVRKERYSYDIIRKTQEYVINLVTKELCFANDFCGVKSGRDIDKFKALNLHPEKASKINAPLIKESPVNLECKVKETLDLGSHTMFIAEILAVNVDEKYMTESGRFALNECDLVAYSHGQYYTLGENIGKFGYSVQKKSRT